MNSNTQAFREFLKRRDQAIGTKEPSDMVSTDLFNERTFYKALVNDMLAAKKEVIIFSPFVSKFRTDFLKPTIEKLLKRNISVFFFTRPIEEHEPMLQPQIQCALKRYEELGVSIHYPGRHIHQKVAIIDREILWEGSLNILSHRASNELMRRIPDVDSAMQVMEFLGINHLLAEAYKIKYEKMYQSLVNKSKRNLVHKTKLFWTGLVFPFLLWWLFLLLRVVVLSLKAMKFILSLIIFC